MKAAKVSGGQFEGLPEIVCQRIENIQLSQPKSIGCESEIPMKPTRVYEMSPATIRETEYRRLKIEEDAHV